MPDLEWMDTAACGGIKGFTNLPIAAQQNVCARCTVTTECVEYGLSRATDLAMLTKSHEVYGGLSPNDMAALVRRRRRAGVAALDSGVSRVQVTATLPRVDERRRVLVETVRELLDLHETPAGIAARLGRTPGSIGRALVRAGWPQLGVLFEAEYKRSTVVCDADARRVVS